MMVNESSKSKNFQALFYLSVITTGWVLVISFLSLLKKVPMAVLLGIGGIVISIAQFIIESGWIYVTTMNEEVNFSSLQERIQFAMRRRGSAWFYAQIVIDILYILLMILLG